MSRGSAQEIRTFIAENFRLLLNNGRFMSSIEWHLPYGAGGSERVSVIENRMRAIGELK